MARIVKAWPIVASVALLLAAFPPLWLGLLVFVALAPWLSSLRTTTAWGAFRSGYLFGLLYMLGQMAWLFALVNHWTHHLWLALIPWLLSAVVAALYFAVVGWSAHLCWRTYRPWLIPLAWAGMEVIRSYIPGLAFPWGLAATPLWPYPPVIQGAFYGTIYLVSAWVVLANVIVVQALAGAKAVELRNQAIVWVLLLGVSLIRYAEPPQGKIESFVIGQPGVDLAFLDPADQQIGLARNLGGIFARTVLQHPRLLVLPEGLTGPSNDIPPPMPFAIPEGTALIFGGQRGTDPTYQTAYAFDGKWSYADKRRLVIFGEYVPGRGKLPLLERFNLPGADLSPSRETRALPVNGIRVGPMLCFEALFGDVAQDQVANGAQVLAVMSIDDWYMGTPAPEQLRVASIWRAVETGLPLLRSASLGSSMAVDARGRIVVEAPLREPVALRADLPVPAGPESMPLRPWIPWLLAASVPIVPAISLLTLRAKRA